MSANDRQEGGEHYKRLKPEPWDVTAAWGLDFFLGNANKYIARAARKSGEAQKMDLKKAIHYLEKKLELVQQSEVDYKAGREIRSVEVVEELVCVRDGRCTDFNLCAELGHCRLRTAHK